MKVKISLKVMKGIKSQRKPQKVVDNSCEKLQFKSLKIMVTQYFFACSSDITKKLVEPER